MAQIHGQIDSLKQIRKTLDSRGISRFNSVNELHDFLKNYRSEEKLIEKRFENELAKDVIDLKQSINYNNDVLQRVRNKSLEKLNRKIIANFNRKTQIKKEYDKSYIEKLFASMIVKVLDTRFNYLLNNYDNILQKATIEVEKEINSKHQTLKRFTLEKDIEVNNRSKKDIKQLAQIKDVVTNLNPLIAGAIGENLVVNEIKKLSDDYILINNFSLALDTPLYYKKDKSKIHSIQIDHLLISKAGIFILETKNWSRRSINSANFRSPVAQINRSSYALFVLLSRRNVNLKKHVWGANKQIPIRNIVVMINKKPKGQFKHVKIKTLKELNAYIEYFDPIFNDQELHKIYIGLISLT
ncbi:nuclease-related domain-containing protein [Lutimonas halocynthiae]|uniref:nuclease-related domain-containing protein n=1 Tax=Lutimonas halocynthiae TaxID=1446477 RepID=UPI0025B53121|nr:nuclease-related domain-containing protein [Lutimonas halocynthiae]MDN3642909.1 nuclease-related domain-containing protein [Lutimonas halocynthiae]